MVNYFTTIGQLFFNAAHVHIHVITSRRKQLHWETKQQPMGEFMTKFVLVLYLEISYVMSNG
jgi:diadenosine tetraphosphate (Ap4A) HIT family hydrolase